MSKLSKRLLSEQRPPGPGLPCGVGRLIASVSEEDRKALEIVFASPSSSGGITNVQIHKILMEEGHEVAFGSVRMHRSKRCRCYIGKAAIYQEKLRAAGV